MGRHAKTIVEYRDYNLPVHFPILLLCGNRWQISDIPSGVLHFHNCMELGICDSDSGTLEFEDLPFSFEAGDITAISSDMPHTTYSTDGTTSQWTYLFVDPVELLRPFFPIEMLPNSGLFNSLLHGYRAILNRRDYLYLHTLLRAIIEEMQQKNLNYEISVRGLFLALITELMRIRSVEGRPAVQSALPIAPALEYMNQNFAEKFTIDELAAECLMSTSHFRRIFGEIMGMGPLEHLNRLRILKSCTFLRMTEQPILFISEQVGFRSLSGFNRHFAALMSESPTSWRKRMNANKNLTILKYSGWL